MKLRTDGKLTLQESADLQQKTLASLRASLSAELRADDKRLADTLAAELKTREASRRANKDFLLALDNSLRQGLGFGLVHFLPHRRAEALPEGALLNRASVCASSFWVRFSRLVLEACSDIFWECVELVLECLDIVWEGV